MAENQIGFTESFPIELTPTQLQVLEILRTAQSVKYPLGDWYLGSIYAAKNTYNPDRYSQAAQSMRELLEKLPRVFSESEVQEQNHNFRNMRDKLYSRMCSDKNRYEGEWEGKPIDFELDKTIRDIDSYLEANKVPTRKEHIHTVMEKLDPMHDALDQRIRSEKSRRFHKLWGQFEGLAHHNFSVDEKGFWDRLAQVERLIIDLLAPITAQDQTTINTIISKTHLEEDDIRSLIKLIKRRGANYVFFFKMVESPAWIDPLVENGFFKSLPNVEAAGNGSSIIPLWWPIFYLQKVSTLIPEKVVEIILGLEKTDNPRILREIFSIACNLPDTDLSLRLKPLIKRFLQSPYLWGDEELIVKILQKWGNAPGSTRMAAYEIIKYVIAFQADPKVEEKRSLRQKDPNALFTSLEPNPRFDQWEYQQILENGVRPLAENEPYQVACILINAVANLIRLGIHSEDLDERQDEDLSDIWCRRLDRPDRDYQGAEETLVHTLTYACEHVYDKARDSIDELDQVLRNQRWKLFKRLRQHLYSSHPNNQTLPWIREFILEHDHYSKREHHYEFQMMIRKAAEHFGSDLLSADERSAIFDAILSGPSKDDFREWMGKRYSDEAFQERQSFFQRLQLRPFKTLLSGDIRRYYDQLEDETKAESVTDDSYWPYGGERGGFISYRSPNSAEELEKLNDEEILAYLNDWNDEHRDKDNWSIKIDISALSEVFHFLFKERIAPNGERLAFWMANREAIARPIYVAAMVKAMQEEVKENNFDNLDQWIEFCAWILTHPDLERIEGQPEPQDRSRNHPDWSSSRRNVVDFIGTCVNRDSSAPITVRDGLAHLLHLVCCQFDWRLDQKRLVLLNRNDPITEAINNTRSRALETLVNFGFWIRHHLPEDPVPEVTDILSKRMAVDAHIPLTRPEHALLGMHFGNLTTLNQNWARGQRKILFPLDNLPVWRDAFINYLRFNRPFSRTFDILKEDFKFAVKNLNLLMDEEDDGKELVEKLGQHLFTYYLLQVYPLTGEESLLERFYDKTKDDRKCWARLFDHVGRSMKNSGKHLDGGLTELAIAYFDWRFEAAEPLELQEFTFWLEAECLDSEWRLRSYIKILDLRSVKGVALSLKVRALNKLLPDHPSLVVECFAKITDAMGQDKQTYISANEAKLILSAGLNSEDPQVRINAERARENLLRLGRFEYLDVE